MQRFLLLAVALAAVLLPAACATNTDSRVTKRATQGVVVQAALDDVWQAVCATLPGSRSAGVPMSAISEYGGVAVEARVERYNDARTILHVTSADARVAEEVQLAIQRRLMR
ncbi:MAG: hypothetical protein R3F49_11495 [Planctomycetota bacterium]